VGLEAYVTIAVTLALNEETRSQVLSRYSLDERRWLNIEKTWLLRVATAALAGDQTLLEEHDEATIRAQDAATAKAPALSPETYAAIVADLEAGAPLAETLQARGVGPIAFSASSRHWARVHAAEPSALASFRGLVDAARTGG
jgi:hypothetical protein